MNGIDVLVEQVFHCTNSECGHVFLAEYGGGKMMNGATFHFICSWPRVPSLKSIPDSVTAISPVFLKIFNEAYAAEQVLLNEIAGMGYRKALEFLIKDYLIAENDDESFAEAIRKKRLGKCINDHVKEERIKECAKRAVWLGNDETHYERRWVDKDIDDLKILVHLTVNWIDSEATMKKYLDEMPG